MISSLVGHVMSRGRRVPRQGFTQLTSKIGPIGYYKGKGGANIGRHTSKGKYVVQEWKLMRVGGQYMPPEKDYLKPYVGFR